MTMLAQARRIAPLVVMLALTTRGSAQVIPPTGAPPGQRTGMIVGRVVDAVTGAPVGEAIVRLTLPKYVDDPTTPKGRVMAPTNHGYHGRNREGSESNGRSGRVRRLSGGHDRCVQRAELPCRRPCSPTSDPTSSDSEPRSSARRAVAISGSNRCASRDERARLRTDR